MRPHVFYSMHKLFQFFLGGSGVSSSFLAVASSAIFLSSFAVSLLGECCLCSVLDPANFRENTKRSYQRFF